MAYKVCRVPIEDEAWTLRDLIGLLPQRVQDYGDFICCAAVCQDWRSIFVECKPPLQPFLMSVEREDDDLRDFYDIFEGKNITFSLPEVQGRWFFPTNYGWVLTFGLDLEIHLVHPLSKDRIRLPAADKFPFPDEITGFLNAIGSEREWLHRDWLRSTLIKKVCLTSNPQEENCVVVVIYSPFKDERVAFARSGDSSWTNVTMASSYSEFIFFDGMFYAIGRFGYMDKYDINLSKPDVKLVVRSFPLLIQSYRDYSKNYPVYLVESFGNILAVERITSEKWEKELMLDEETMEMVETPIRNLIDKHTTSFEVYKLEKNGENDRMEWSMVMDLGDCALFLGSNSSMSIPTKNNKGIRRNCIYFTDEYEYLGTFGTKSSSVEINGYDQGIFSLDDGKIERGFTSVNQYSSFSAPSWLLFSSFNL